MDNLTLAQKKLVQLNRTYEHRIKPFYKEYDEAMAAVVNESGLDFMFQDDQGVVYRVSKWKGMMVKAKDFCVERTRRLFEGETRGNFGISLKDARESGFEVEGK